MKQNHGSKLLPLKTVVLKISWSLMHQHRLITLFSLSSEQAGAGPSWESWWWWWEPCSHQEMCYWPAKRTWLISNERQPYVSSAALYVIHAQCSAFAGHCTGLHWAKLRTGEWNGREHGVWEQREMKRMIANIVLNWDVAERAQATKSGGGAAVKQCWVFRTAGQRQAIEQNLIKEMAAFQMHGIWPMNSEQKNMLFCAMGSISGNLMAKKCLNFIHLGWVNEA